MKLNEFSEFLCHMTGGMLSKTNYTAQAMISAAEDYQQRVCDNYCALRAVSREQVERMRGEWQVCFEDWRKQMAGDQCSKCGFQHYGTSTHHYKFCPACGAPMTDEAVDIIMRRLETLYETT